MWKDEENLEKEKWKWYYDEEIKFEEVKLEIKWEFEKKMGEVWRKLLKEGVDELLKLIINKF